MSLFSFLLSKSPKIVNATFDPAWIPILEKDFRLYRELPEVLREKLHDKIALFIATKSFEGCNGFELSDEVIVLISAQACILILNQDELPYPQLHTVLVYPSTFKSMQPTASTGGIITEQEVSRLGESWTTGTVILAWDATLHGGRDPLDGHNVTIHEFAHQLDQDDGVADGAPLSRFSRQEAIVWCRVMSNSYERYLKIANKRGKTVIDRYGATNPAEFFAVVTETFFEKPKQLSRKWPELYELMVDFYRLDPLAW